MNDAWDIAYQFLDSGEVILQNFGATTFCMKISSEWDQLGDAFKDNIRQALQLKVAHFSRGPPIILKQLSLALAKIILHSMPDKWPAFFDEILPLANDENTANAFVEITRSLAQEANRISATIKVRIKPQLDNITQKLIPLLLGYLSLDCSKSQGIEHLKKAVLTCITQWLDLDIAIETFESIVTSVVHLILNGGSPYITPAVEVLTNIYQNGRLFRYPKTIHKIIENTFELIPLSRHAIQSRDAETTNSLCLLYSVIGEYHSAIVVNNKNFAGVLIGIILEYTAYPDYMIASLTYQFWYEIHETLLQIGENDPITEQFKPVFLQLMRILESQCAFPLSPLDNDDRYDFDSFRTESGDTILNCYNILGEGCLVAMCEDLKHLLDSLSSKQNEELLYYINLIESNLYLWKYLTEVLTPHEIEYVNTVLELYPQLPKNSIQLQDTALRLLGDLADYLKGNDQLIIKVLGYIIPCFQHPQLVPAVCHAFNEICLASPKTLLPHINELYESTSPILLSISSADRIKIIKGLSSVGTFLPLEQGQTFLLTLLNPFMKRIQDVISSNHNEEEHYLMICEDIDALVSGCCELEDLQAGHPFEVIFALFFELFIKAFQKFVTSESIVCQLCKYLMASLNMLPHRIILDRFEQILLILTNGFSENGCVDILKTIATVLRILVNNDENAKSIHITQVHIEIVSKSFDFLTDKMISIVQGSINQNNRMFINPELIKGYFDYVIRAILTELPLAFFCSALVVEKVLSFGVTLLSYVAEGGSCKSVVYFIKSFYSLKNEDCMMIVDPIKEKYFAELIRTLLSGIGGATPQSLARYVVDLLSFLVRKFPQSKTIISSLLSQPDYPSKNVSSSRKNQFLTQLYSTNSKKQEIISIFGNECRGRS